MNHEQNSHDAPASSPEADPQPAAPFGAAVARGFSAAHRTLVGAVLAFVILGPMQISSYISGALMMKGGFQPPAEGQPPSAELLSIIGLGLFSCLWIPVMIFAFPWVIAGIAGRVRDHVFDRELGGFSEHGKRYYGRILCLLLLYFGVLLVLFMPFWIAGAVTGAQQAQADAFDPQQLREMQRSPGNLALGVGFALLLTLFGTLLNLVQANLVVEDTTVTNAITGGLRFVGRRFADFSKLFGVYLLLAIPMFFMQQVGNFLPDITVLVMAVLGLVTTVYISYLSVVNVGIGVSVYAARRPAPNESS